MSSFLSETTGAGFTKPSRPGYILCLPQYSAEISGKRNCRRSGHVSGNPAVSDRFRRVFRSFVILHSLFSDAHHGKVTRNAKGSGRSRKIHQRSVLRQMHFLPGRHKADAADSHGLTSALSLKGRPVPAFRTRGTHRSHSALRTRQKHRTAGSFRPGTSGQHRTGHRGISARPLSGTDFLSHRPCTVQRLFPMCPQLSCKRHKRRHQAAFRHQP